MSDQVNVNIRRIEVEGGFDPDRFVRDLARPTRAIREQRIEVRHPRPDRFCGELARAFGMAHTKKIENRLKKLQQSKVNAKIWSPSPTFDGLGWGIALAVYCHLLAWILFFVALAVS